MPPFPDPSASYLLDTDAVEIRRLQVQHETWRPETDQLMDAAGITPGMRILECGSGPGFTTFDLADRVGPTGAVVAIEASDAFVTTLQTRASTFKKDWISVQQGDACALEVPERSFDIAFMRWLLCYLSTPEKVINEAAAALKPGGALAVLDYFNYFGAGVFPEPQLSAPIFRGYEASVRARGGSFFVGDRLTRMMSDAGLAIETSFPIVRIAPPGSPAWEWLGRFNAGYQQHLLENGFLTQREADQFNAYWERCKTDPAAFFYTPPMIGVVGRKPPA